MPKKLSWWCVAGLLLFFVSCFETEEEVEIKDNNSGMYTMSVNMGGFIAMMQQMQAAQQLESGEVQMPKSMDTTIYFRSVSDTLSGFTERERQVLRDGSLRWTMEPEKEVMYYRVFVPFKTLDDLMYVRKNLSEWMKKMKADALLTKNLLGEKADEIAGADSEANQGLGGDRPGGIPTGSANGADLLATPGRISSQILDTSIFTELRNNDTLQSTMAMLSGMMGDSKGKFTLILPRPVKKYSGSNAVLSADKRKITFSYNITDLISNPKVTEFNVEY